MFWMLSWLRTSSSSERTRLPVFLISSWNAARVFASRLVITKSAPAFARARAMCCPRPRLVPVTIATCPLRSKSPLVMDVSSCVGSEDHLHQIWLAGVESLEPARPILKWGNGGDEWLDLDFSARYQF